MAEDKTSSNPDQPVSIVDALNQAKAVFSERAERERQAWLSRPRLHLNVFAETRHFEMQIEKCFAYGDSEPGKIVITTGLDIGAADAIAKELGWSAEQLSSFKVLAYAYSEDPSPKNYLEIRKTFPEVDIQVAKFGGIDPLFALQDEFKKQDVDPQLVVGVLDGDEDRIDALCLRLLALIFEKESLPKSGPGALERRRAAISEATVNYLISTMLEAVDWNQNPIQMPGSLVVLVRYQLCGTMPDLHAAYLSSEKRENAALRAARQTKPNERLSVRKLAKLADVPPATAARWLADPDFLYLIEICRAAAAGKPPPAPKSI